MTSYLERNYMNNNNFCFNLVKYANMLFILIILVDTLRLSTKSQLMLVTLCITLFTIKMDIIYNVFIIIKLIFYLGYSEYNKLIRLCTMNIVLRANSTDNRYVWTATEFIQYITKTNLIMLYCRKSPSWFLKYVS